MLLQVLQPFMAMPFDIPFIEVIGPDNRQSLYASIMLDPDLHPGDFVARSIIGVFQCAAVAPHLDMQLPLVLKLWARNPKGIPVDVLCEHDLKRDIVATLVAEARHRFRCSFPVRVCLVKVLHSPQSSAATI